MQLSPAFFRKRHVTERLRVLSLALREGNAMEKKYWLGRKQASLAMARGAASDEARLIHYDLAGRYSVKAAAASAHMPASAAAAPPLAPGLELPLPRRDPDRT
jgi:hypothetical protein